MRHSWASKTALESCDPLQVFRGVIIHGQWRQYHPDWPPSEHRSNRGSVPPFDRSVIVSHACRLTAALLSTAPPCGAEAWVLSVMCSCRRRCLTERRQSRSTQIPVTATSRSLRMPQLHTRTSAQAPRNLSTRHRARPVSIRSISRAHRCTTSAAIWARPARIRTSCSRCMPCLRATREAQLRLADSAAIDPAASGNGKRTSRGLRPRL